MSQTAPLLIEIGCEDLPARYVVPLAEALSALGTITVVAPGLYSTVTGCPQRTESFSVSMRVTRSGLPAGRLGMMILTGLLGHGAAVCAAAFSEVKAQVQAASTPSKIVRW